MGSLGNRDLYFASIFGIKEIPSSPLYRPWNLEKFQVLFPRISRDLLFFFLGKGAGDDKVWRVSSAASIIRFVRVVIIFSYKGGRREMEIG